MRKTRNLQIGVSRDREGIRRIHNTGITAAGAFVLGSDGDTRDLFERTVQFVLDTSVDSAQFTILTPLPGTRLYRRQKQEGRLLRTNYPEERNMPMAVLAYSVNHSLRSVATSKWDHAKNAPPSQAAVSNLPQPVPPGGNREGKPLEIR